MDLFEQLNTIDQLVGEQEEKKVQEALFSKPQGHAMDFLVDDMVWQEIALEKAKKAEQEKLKPLSAGFGPWSW